MVSNNLINKTSDVITNVADNTQKAITNVSGSAQKAISDTTQNVSQGLGKLGWPLAIAAIVGGVILLKK
jgi:hypothetical protein